MPLPAEGQHDSANLATHIRPPHFPPERGNHGSIRPALQQRDFHCQSLSSALPLLNFLQSPSPRIATAMAASSSSLEARLFLKPLLEASLHGRHREFEQIPASQFLKD
jgi:hypothetical protein